MSSVCRVGCSADCNPLGIAVAPTVSGYWQYVIQTEYRTVKDASVASRLTGVLLEIRERAYVEFGEIASAVIRLRRQARKGWEFLDVSPLPSCPGMVEESRRLALKAQEQLPKRQMHPEIAELVKVEEDPYTVATDGSVGGSRSGWAAITGAGWLRVEYLDRHLETSIAELKGILLGIRSYPLGSPVRVLTDSQDCVDLIKSLDQWKNPALAFAAYPQFTLPCGREAVADFMRLREDNADFSVEWKRRRSTPMLMHVDAFAQQIRGDRSYRRELETAPRRWKPPRPGEFELSF